MTDAAVSPREERFRIWRWSALVPVLIAVIAYWWVLDGWFLYDDFTQGYLLKHDASGIAGNWGPIFQDFGRAQFGIEDWVYYRAMMSVYLTGCLELFGVDPVSLHAVNLVHHAVLTLFVALLCSWYGRGSPHLAAVCGGAWFALHPVTVEAIAWFSANTVTFELLARLGAIVAFAVHVNGGRRRWLVLSMVLAALGLLTKESGINVVLGLLAVHLLRRPAPTLGELIRKQLLFLPIWIGYFLLRYFALGMFLAGSKGHAGTFLEALPENGPIQAKLVFLPFGGVLPDGLLLVIGIAFLLWALGSGLRSRWGLFVLLVGGLWLASQFVPTALNRVYPNLGSSRAHYGTISSAALWLALLAFGRRRDHRVLPWIGAALFAAVLVAFLPVRSLRQQRFEDAWQENRLIHAELVAHAEGATPERPVGVVWTPYDPHGVPQLNRTAHFTLCEVPFTPRDNPVVGLTTILEHGGLVEWTTEGVVEWAMKGDTSPHRALLELGGKLLWWDQDQQRFRVREPLPTRVLPPLQRSPDDPMTFRFPSDAAVQPEEIEIVELRVRGDPSGGRLTWRTSELRFGGGRTEGEETVFRIDLTHDLGFWLAHLVGGIERLTVAFEEDGDFEVLAMCASPRLPRLKNRQQLRGREIIFGREAASLGAPLLPDPGLELRLVLLSPSEPIEITEVEPGQPVTFPRRLRSEFTRLMRLSRQKRFYYYFEARSPDGRALGGARSPVDWFRLVPSEQR